MHMISFFDVVDFMATYCQKNGGHLGPYPDSSD